MNKIIKFHIDNGYYVQVKPLPKMIGCSADFPKNIILNKSATHRTYIISDNLLEVFHKEDGKDIASKKIGVDKIGIRLLILEDILLQTTHRNISSKLIVVENKNNVFDILDVEMSKDELAFEKELCLKFRELLSGRVKNDVVNGNLVESYKKVLECFENGGL